jgi:hypothetical protein
MADWKVSSKMGFEFEDFCLLDLNEKKFPLAYKNMKKEDFSFYDIIIPSENNPNNIKTIECKFDYKAKETQNICIEVGCNGRLSGLTISKANYWIISDGEESFIIEKQKINDCIVENLNNGVWKKNKCNVEQENGVWKEMDIYLIPKRIFIKYCIEIGSINNLTYDSLNI